MLRPKTAATAFVVFAASSFAPALKGIVDVFDGTDAGVESLLHGQRHGNVTRDVQSRRANHLQFTLKDAELAMAAAAARLVPPAVRPDV
jgi:hypothetical protein